MDCCELIQSLPNVTGSQGDLKSLDVTGGKKGEGVVGWVGKTFGKNYSEY